MTIASKLKGNDRGEKDLNYIQEFRDLSYINKLLKLI